MTCDGGKCQYPKSKEGELCSMDQDVFARECKATDEIEIYDPTTWNDVSPRKITLTVPLYCQGHEYLKGVAQEYDPTSDAGTRGKTAGSQALVQIADPDPRGKRKAASMMQGMHYSTDDAGVETYYDGLCTVVPQTTAGGLCQRSIFLPRRCGKCESNCDGRDGEQMFCVIPQPGGSLDGEKSGNQPFTGTCEVIGKLNANCNRSLRYTRRCDTDQGLICKTDWDENAVNTKNTAGKCQCRDPLDAGARSGYCDVSSGCGDGVLDNAAGEQCDDGNLVDGDGCNSSCMCELGSPLASCQCGNLNSDASENDSEFDRQVGKCVCPDGFTAPDLAFVGGQYVGTCEAVSCEDPLKPFQQGGGDTCTCQTGYDSSNVTWNRELQKWAGGCDPKSCGNLLPSGQKAIGSGGCSKTGTCEVVCEAGFSVLGDNPQEFVCDGTSEINGLTPARCKASCTGASPAATFEGYIWVSNGVAGNDSATFAGGHEVTAADLQCAAGLEGTPEPPLAGSGGAATISCDNPGQNFGLNYGRGPTGCCPAGSCQPKPDDECPVCFDFGGVRTCFCSNTCAAYADATCDVCNAESACVFVPN